MDMPQLVVGDPTRIRQVLFNLIGNAIKFTASGEVVVNVEEQWRSDDELGIHVSVPDTGIGIPGDRLRSIFDSFTQVDSSMARKFGGTGLGLTITAQLLAMMKGRIWVRSEEGKGSTFHFSIPLRLSQKPRLGGSRDASMLSGRTALVVDDNATNRKILQDMLGHWGMRTTSSDGAAAALKELENAARKDQPFDIILLDGMMPVVDGFQLAGMIKQRPDLKCGTIMMLSSADQPQSAEKCKQLAIMNYLVKPISAASLLDAILVALGDEEAVREKTEADVSREEATQDGVKQTAASRELRILVVDDHEANRQLARKILERRGHRCTEAKDGREAMETLNEYTCDLVLMDVQMPNMDGFQATGAIRESEDNAGHRLPIVALTAHAMSGDRDKCLAAGMDAYLSKPINARELVAVVERLGGASPATQRNATSSPHGEPSGNAAYDFAAALDRVDGEVDLLLDTMNFFLKDSPGLLNQISDAIKQSNGAALQSAAHRLKSLIASFDHDRGVKITQQLEHMGRQCEFETADESVCELIKIVQQLRSVIGDFRDKHADSTDHPAARSL
jgi:CheY-like chemotaxis protein/HPt (histidine-containing phosphotransfer) domain-containing protein